jgi:acetolactate synthase-1/2/3 large subunit
MLNDCEFPLILAGAGIRLGGAVDAFREFVNQSQIPVVHSLMAVDVLPSKSIQRVGMIGSYGNRWANKALAAADVLLVLGSRLDVRQTGGSVTKFQENKTIIRVDVDEFELNGRVIADINLKMSISDFISRIGLIEPSDNAIEFTKKIQQWKVDFPAVDEQEVSIDLNPNFLMEWLSENFSEVSGYSVDVGQHQMWAAQSIEISASQRFITSGGLGAMGFSTPAAIGATQVSNERWVTIVGDGCLQLSISELQTCFQYQIPVAICIFNNKQHGMVAQFQEENMDSRFIGTRDDYSTPDFMSLSRAFSIPALHVSSKKDLESAREFILKWSKGPIVIEFEVSNQAKALPKLNRNSGLGDL